MTDSLIADHRRSPPSP